MRLEQLERRTFVTLLGAAGANALLATRAFGQQVGKPSVGFLSIGRRDQTLVTAFQQGLADAGLNPELDVDVEYRWADARYEALASLAAELAARKVWVIGAMGLASALAAKPAVTRVPLVFVVEGDPTKFGLVDNLAQPNERATGVSFKLSELTATQFDLLGQLVTNPPATGLLINPNNPSNPQAVEGAQSARANKLIVVKAGQEAELDAAFGSLTSQGAAALVVPPDAFFFSQRQKLVALAAQHKLPTIYPAREFAAAGGLMSYGASISGACRQAGIYAGFILKGTPIPQLAVQQNIQTEFVINLDTAQTMNFTIPVPLLSRADTVIQAR
jgi:putative tryptophan/tyrosine transport system substrate-binding protein